MLHYDDCTLPTVRSIRRSGLGSALQKQHMSPGGPTVIDREIARAETFLAWPSPPPRRDATRNKTAVAAAYDLLDGWGHNAAVTRSGKWARLAKILAGDRTVDLFDHMREFKRHPGPSIERVRGEDGIVYRLRRQ